MIARTSCYCKANFSFSRSTLRITCRQYAGQPILNYLKPWRGALALKNRLAVGGQRVCDRYTIIYCSGSLHLFFFIPAGNSCL